MKRKEGENMEDELEQLFLDFIWEQYHISDSEYYNMTMYEQEDLWNEFDECYGGL